MGTLVKAVSATPGMDVLGLVYNTNLYYFPKSTRRKIASDNLLFTRIRCRSATNSNMSASKAKVGKTFAFRRRKQVNNPEPGCL